MRCRVCGADNSDDARVCGGCKVALRTDTLKGWVGPAAAIAAPAPQDHALPPSARTEGGGGVDDEQRFAPGQRVLGVYAVERQVGRGGMGAVYLARDDVSGQRVAVKVLPGSAARERSARERFIQEARALAALDHPGIVPLITFAQEGDDRFLVMKFVDGRGLDGRLRAERVLPLAVALRVTREVCAALAYAHRRGVVHRDIKPANVLLDAEGRVVIVDFGIARTGDGAPKLTQTGMLMGTPQYMSPEQIAGHVVDGRSDLYACGLLLFEMLAGRPPFDGERTFDILRAHVDQPVPDVRIVRRQTAPDAEPLPDDVVALVEALLQKDPAQRPADGDAVVAIIDGRQPVPRPPSMLPATSSLVPSSTPPVVTPLPTSSLPPSTLAPSALAPSALAPSALAPSALAPSGLPTSTPVTSTPASSGAGAPRSPAGARVTTSATPTFLAPVFTDQREDSLAVARPRSGRGGAALLVLAGVGAAVGFVVVGRPLATAPVVDAVVDAGVVASDEFTRAVLLSRAQVAREAGELDDARVAVDTLLRLQPGDVEALLLRAAILVEGGNADEAATTLGRLPAPLRDAEAQRRVTLEAAIASLRAAPVDAGPSPSPPPRGGDRPADAGAASSPSSSPSSPRPPRPSELDEAARRAVSAGSVERIEACYTQWVLASDPAAAGEVVLALEVALDGTVTATKVQRSAFANIAFHDCLRDVVRGWRFPPFAGAPDAVLHSFRFTPRR